MKRDRNRRRLGEKREPLKKPVSGEPVNSVQKHLEEELKQISARHTFGEATAGEYYSAQERLREYEEWNRTWTDSL